MIRAGSMVIVYLRDPRERIWGILRALDLSGLSMEGFAVDSFDAWLRAVEGGADAREGMSVVFFPMQRVERVLLDRGSREIPSLSERFQARLGMSVADYLGPGPEERS
jgi:hypothetical protein